VPVRCQTTDQPDRSQTAAAAFAIPDRWQESNWRASLQTTVPKTVKIIFCRVKQRVFLGHCVTDRSPRNSTTPSSLARRTLPMLLSLPYWRHIGRAVKGTAPHTEVSSHAAASMAKNRKTGYDLPVV